MKNGKKILSPIWEEIKKKEGYEEEGVVVIPSDPNALLERLDLLLASQEAGHTGVENELVSICDELKRQGVLDTKTYKELNSIIKQEGHDGPVSLHWLIREIHSYQTLHYLGIGLKHKTPYKD